MAQTSQTKHLTQLDFDISKLQTQLTAIKNELINLQSSNLTEIELKLKANELLQDLSSINKAIESGTTKCVNAEKQRTNAIKQSSDALKQVGAQEKSNAEYTKTKQTSEKALLSVYRQSAELQAKMRSLKSSDNALLAQQAQKIREVAESLYKQYATNDKITDEMQVQTAELQKQLNLQKTQASVLKADASNINSTPDVQRIQGASINLGQMFSYAKQTATEAIKVIRDVETAGVDLARVLDLTAEQTQKITTDMFNIAVAYGRSFQDTADITLRFAQAGYSQSESLSMTQNALLAMNTAELDAVNSTESMIGILQQWGMDATELIDVIDKLNYTADNNAITTQDLVDGLLKASGVAKTANLSFEDTIGILTAMKESSGAAGKEVGNAFKSILAYIQRPMSLEWFDSNGIQVYADESKNALLPMMQILKNMSESWKKFSSSQQDALMSQMDAAGLFTEEMAEVAGATEDYAAYVEASTAATDQLNTAEARNQANMAAGVYRRNYYVALMENFSKATQVSKEALDAEGHSAAENEKYMQTLEAKYQQLIASLQQLAVEAGNAGLMDLAKGAVDAASSVTKLTRNIGGLKNLLITISGIIVILKKNQIANMFASAINGLQVAKEKLKELQIHLAAGSSGFKTLGSAIKTSISNMNIGTALGAAITAIGLVTSAISYANQKAKEAREEATKNTQATREQITALQDQKQAYLNIVDSTDSEAEKNAKLAEWKQNLIEQYGLEKEAIDAVTLARQSGIDAIDAEMAKEAEKWMGSSDYDEYEKARKIIEDGYNNNIFSDARGYVDSKHYATSWGSALVEARELQELMKELKIDWVTIGESSNSTTLDFDSTNAIDQQEKLTQIIAGLNEKKEQGIELSYTESELLKTLSKDNDNLKDKLADVQELYTEGNKNLATLKFQDFEAKNPIDTIKSQADFDAWKANLVALAGESTGVAQVLSDMADDTFPQYAQSAQEAATATEQLTAAEQVMANTQKLGDVLSDATTRLDAYSTAQSKASEALTEQNKNGSLTVETYKSLVDANSDYAGAVEKVNGKLKINAEKIRELNKAEGESMKKQVADEIQRQTNEYKNNLAVIGDLQKKKASLTDDEKAELSARLEQNSAIAESIRQYELLQGQIEYTTGALKAWRDAQNTTDYGDYYDEMYSGYKEMLDMLDNWEIGTNKWKIGVELFIPESEWEHQDIYLKEKVSRYLTEDMSGVQHALSDLGDEFITVDEKTQTINLAENIGMDDLQNKLNVTSYVWSALVDNLTAHGYTIKCDDTDITKAMQDVAKLLAAQELLDQLESQPQVNVQGVEEQKKKVNDLKEAVSAIPKEVLSQFGIEIDENTNELIVNGVRISLSTDDNTQEGVDSAKENVESVKDEVESNPVKLTTKDDTKSGTDSAKQNVAIAKSEMEKPVEIPVKYSLGKPEALNASPLEGTSTEIETTQNITVTVDDSQAEAALIALHAQLNNISEKAETVSGIQIGKLGAEETKLHLSDVLNALQKIEDFKFTDKSVKVSADATGFWIAVQSIRNAEMPVKTVRIQTKTDGQLASGTDNATRGNYLVGEKGREVVVTRDSWFVAEEPMIIPLNHGDMVFNNRDTEKILAGMGKRAIEGKAGKAYASGTENYAALMALLQKNIKDIGGSHGKDLNFNPNGYDLDLFLASINHDEAMGKFEDNELKHIKMLEYALNHLATDREDKWKLEEEIYKLRKSYMEEEQAIVDERIADFEHLNNMGVWTTDQQIGFYRELLNTASFTTDKQREYETKLYDLYVKQINEKIKLAEEEYNKRVEAINDAADKEIAALQKVKEERSRSNDEEDYYEQRKKLLEDLAYWEERTGRNAVEQQKDLKEQLAELDKDWARKQEDWKTEDQIQEIEDERDRQTAALEESWKAVQDKFTEENIDMLARAGVYSESLYQEYFNNFLSPFMDGMEDVGSALDKLAASTLPSGDVPGTAKPLNITQIQDGNGGSAGGSGSSNAGNISEGSVAKASSSAQIYAYKNGSGQSQYYANDPRYRVLKIDGDWVQVRHATLSNGVTGWFKKSDLTPYAMGTYNAIANRPILINENGLEALTTPDGTVTSLPSRGYGVIPSNITKNLTKIGKIDAGALDRTVRDSKTLKLIYEQNARQREDQLNRLVAGLNKAARIVENITQQYYNTVNRNENHSVVYQDNRTVNLNNKVSDKADAQFIINQARRQFEDAMVRAWHR